MDRDSIAGLKHFTKKQKAAIGKLGSEWAVLDSAENLISRLIFERYQAHTPGMKLTPALVELEAQQREIFERKREINAELEDREAGIVPRPRIPGRTRNPFIRMRDTTIRELQLRSDEEICKRLDFEFGQGEEPAVALPERWVDNYSIKSYFQAYSHPKCRPLVQKLISVAKAA